MNKINTAVIALGSNINPRENILKAQKLIAQKFIILGESKFIQTKPIGFTNQADFTNGSIYIETHLDYTQIDQTLKNMETELGREKSSLKYGPRTIDLDIAIFNNKVVDSDFYSRQYLKDSVLELIPELQY